MEPGTDAWEQWKQLERDVASQMLAGLKKAARGESDD